MILTPITPVNTLSISTSRSSTSVAKKLIRIWDEAGLRQAICDMCVIYL
uniref:Uncharacterized protein n=1 Tax=Anguilla anguilla TaxID=7936 RepID=A0A0E9W4E0_ANGAN